MPQFLLHQPSVDMAMMSAYAAAGWHDVVIDLEHGPHGESDVLRAATALGYAGATTHLKLPDLDPVRYARYAEFGIRHFMLPHVERGTEIAAIAQRLAEIPKVDPETIHLYPLIESRTAITRLDEICAAPLVAGIQIGLVDLAIELGFSFSGFSSFAGQGDALISHLLPILDAIRAAGKPNGCLLLPNWLASFPLERADRITIPVSELLSINQLRVA